MAEQSKTRREAVAEHKRALILEAAREVFAQEGLEGASLRAIAARAGYTPAALYFHFASREDIYAEVLTASLRALGQAVTQAAQAQDPAVRLSAAAMAFFDFYQGNPRDLDLGFYLFRGGMRPAGLGPERDQALNGALAQALAPIPKAAVAMGVSRADADLLLVDCFAHAAGLLLLLHTGRIRMFGASARDRMTAYVTDRIADLRSDPRPSNL